MRVALLFVGVLALAGCSDPPGPSAPSDGGASPTSGAPVGGSVAMNGTAVGAAPEWRVGQWWSWRVESASAAAPLEATTAVLAADGDGYQVGAPNPDAAALLFPFHIVALGGVKRGTLAWEAHGAPVQFLRFPLRDGDRFTADFWAAPGAEVVLRAASVQGPDGPEPGFRATATYAGSEAVFAEAEWSLLRGQFVRVATHFGAEAPFATATLLAEGLEARAVKPFLATDLVRWSANLGDPAGLAPRTFSVPADADLVLFVCFLGGAQGHFQATMTLSDLQSAVCQISAPTGVALEYSAQTRPAAAGEGRVTVAPAGQAGVTVEVFAVKTK